MVFGFLQRLSLPSLVVSDNLQVQACQDSLSMYKKFDSPTGKVKSEHKYKRVVNIWTRRDKYLISAIDYWPSPPLEKRNSNVEMIIRVDFSEIWKCLSRK